MDKQTFLNVGLWYARQSRPVRWLLLASMALLVLAVLDLAGNDLVNNVGGNQIAVALAIEGVLVGLAFFLLNDLAERRAAKAWEAPARPAIAALMAGASIAENVLNTALRERDATVWWQALRENVAQYQHEVARLEPILTKTTALAELWNEFNVIANLLAGFIRNDDPSLLRSNLNQPSVVAARARLRGAIASQNARTSRLVEEHYASFVE